MLREVTCRDNGRHGFSVGGASVVELDMCKSTGNGAAQLLTGYCSETHVYDSDLHDALAPAWLDEGSRTYLGENRARGSAKIIKPQDTLRKTSTEEATEKPPQPARNKS